MKTGAGDQQDPLARPYGDAAVGYWEADWMGVLPLRAGAKSPPPSGYTGQDGGWPSRVDVQRWAEERPRANIGLRLPDDVIGLDVDDYDD